MPQGNEIIVTSPPRGVHLEGIIDGTPKPGTVMQIKAAVEPVGGRHTWEDYDVDADGDQRLIAVLLPDQLQGKIAADAYVSGDRGFLYVPLPGEDLNMLVLNIAGTGDLFAIGDILMINDGDGKLIATTGSPESEPFIVMQTVAAITADTLIWCKFTGY